MQRWQRTIEIDGVAHTLFTYVDISEFKRTIAMLRVSHEQMCEFAGAVNEVFWLTDAHNTQISYVSPAYDRMFGRSRARLNTDARDWLNALHPDDRAMMLAVVTSPPSSVSRYQFRVVDPDGSIRFVRAKLFPVLDGDGAVVRLAGLAEDVTEARQLGEEVREAQKMESLGLLAGGVAHDFNNILAVIHCNASILASDLGPSHPGRELIDEVSSAVNRAETLTRQLLAFSRKQVVVPASIDLNLAVNETRKMLKRMVGDDIIVTTSLEPDLGRILIDPGCLVQVLMNLSVNARDAMATGGTLDITTRSGMTDSRREVAVVVSDTGCGMADEIKRRVFEPFFTTKGLGKGTGLGLSVVHGIVEQAGGRIEIESVVGVGTAFRITFPVSDAAGPSAHVVAKGARGTETLLVVDDDNHVRRAISRTLRSLGYRVLESSDGCDALRLVTENRDDLRLLLTDVVMPTMDGRQLAEQARLVKPGLQVLYMSGYADDAVVRHGVERGEASILEKPFTGEDLSTWVRRSIDITYEPTARELPGA